MFVRRRRSMGRRPASKHRPCGDGGASHRDGRVRVPWRERVQTASSRRRCRSSSRGRHSRALINGSHNAKADESGRATRPVESRLVFVVVYWHDPAGVTIVGLTRRARRHATRCGQFYILSDDVSIGRHESHQRTTHVNCRKHLSINLNSSHHDSKPTNEQPAVCNRSYHHDDVSIDHDRMNVDRIV